MSRAPVTDPRCSIERDVGRGHTWQVRAPEGYRFADTDFHAQVANSRKEALAMARQPLEKCPEDCPCLEECDLAPDVDIVDLDDEWSRDATTRPGVIVPMAALVIEARARLARMDAMDAREGEEGSR